MAVGDKNFHWDNKTTKEWLGRKNMLPRILQSYGGGGTILHISLIYPVPYPRQDQEAWADWLDDMESNPDAPQAWHDTLNELESYAEDDAQVFEELGLKYEGAKYTDVGSLFPSYWVSLKAWDDEVPALSQKGI